MRQRLVLIFAIVVIATVVLALYFIRASVTGVLARIDPGPFQAGVDRGTATKAKGGGRLESGKPDLKRCRTAGPLGNTQQRIGAQAALVRPLDATVAADQANIEAARTQLDYTT